MSSDNTILIVKRNNLFRVAHVQAAEDIFEYRDEKVYNYYYKEVRIFTDKNDAHSFALKIRNNIIAKHEPLEYGILFYDWDENKMGEL